MTFALQILPLSLHLFVGFHLYVCLAPLKSVCLIARYEVVEQQRVGTFRAIFGQDAHQQQVDNVCFMTLQRLQYVYPSEGEQSATTTLLQSACERRQRDAHADEWMFGCAPVFNQRHQVQVDHG